MNVHEYGKENKKVIVMLHPSAVRWDYFAYLVPLLENDYHLIIPAIPGYDEENPQDDFTSVEKISDDLAQWLLSHGIQTVDLLYGCSMGGAILIRMFAERKVDYRNVVCDGGIAPYELPWIITRLIAVRDFVGISAGKMIGEKMIGLLGKAFSTDGYTEEDMKYIVRVLRSMSSKTIWNTFLSCDNYSMPESIPAFDGVFQYWYGEKEKGNRKPDIHYVQKRLPYAEFIEMKGLGHASMASLHPQETAERFRALLEEAPNKEKT